MFMVSRGGLIRRHVPFKGSVFSGTVWYVGVVVGSKALGGSEICVGQGILGWVVGRISVLSVDGTVDLSGQKEFFLKVRVWSMGQLWEWICYV